MTKSLLSQSRDRRQHDEYPWGWFAKTLFVVLALAAIVYGCVQVSQGPCGNDMSEKGPLTVRKCAEQGHPVDP